MYESCISFESNLETLIKLLTTKNIEWILIINTSFKWESKSNQNRDLKVASGMKEITAKISLAEFSKLLVYYDSKMSDKQ